MIESTKCNSATNAKCNDAMQDVETVPAMPEGAFNNLPVLLKELCSLIDEPHKRDVFLVSALPVIASHLHNVIAAHSDGYYTPDLYTLIVADPGTGKGISSKAKKLSNALNKYLTEQSQRERDQYNSLSDSDKGKVSPPKDRSLIIPANTSARAIYDTIDANDGAGLLFENEIDTMLSATSQEWGNFSDICRKAFHHEALSINRKNERYFIENPRLSMCLSGTFDQFKKMFESAENGHFSRYGLYTFNAPRIWQSHRPTAKSRELDVQLDKASEVMFNIYKLLTAREQALYIDLTADQWQMIDNTFAEKMEMIEAHDLSKYLHATNNRAAVIALRIISIFTILRAYQNNPGDLNRVAITPDDEDMISALLIADTLTDHAFRLFYILPKSNSDSKGERFNQFLSSIPKEFETTDALLLAENLGIPERTTKYWLSSSPEFKRIKRGHYEKV